MATKTTKPADAGAVEAKASTSNGGSGAGTASKWLKVGTIRTGKKPGSTYVKIEQDLKAGSVLQIQDPRETLKTLVEKGILTEEQATGRGDKIPAFILRELVLPPQD